MLNSNDLHAYVTAFLTAVDVQVQLFCGFTESFVVSRCATQGCVLQMVEDVKLLQLHSAGLMAHQETMWSSYCHF